MPLTSERLRLPVQAIALRLAAADEAAALQRGLLEEERAARAREREAAAAAALGEQKKVRSPRSDSD